MVEDNRLLTKNKKIDKRISFAIVFQLAMLITNYSIKEFFSIDDPNAMWWVSLFFMLLVGGISKV